MCINVHTCTYTYINKLYTSAHMHIFIRTRIPKQAELNGQSGHVSGYDEGKGAKQRVGVEFVKGVPLSIKTSNLRTVL